jgi:uncharacterized protein (TIGR03067 family)
MNAINKPVRKVDALLPITDRGSIDIRNALAALAGQWIVTVVERDGQPLEAYRGALRTMTGDIYTLARRDGEVIRGTFSIGGDNRRALIDLRPTIGEFRGRTLLGIYDLDGEALRICFAEPGQPRPTEFRSPPGSGQILAVQHRA